MVWMMFVDLGDNYDMTESSFTVCGWAKPENATQGYIFGTFNTGTSQGFWLRAQSGNEWSAGTVSGTDLNLASSVDFGVWQHVCAVINPSPQTSYLYKNSVVIDSGTSITATVDSGVSATIGNRYDNNRDWEGRLDDIRVYNRALTAQEVSQLYYYGLSGGLGGVSGNCSNPSMPEGSMFYSGSEGVMQYCNGEKWIGIGWAP